MNRPQSLCTAGRFPAGGPGRAAGWGRAQSAFPKPALPASLSAPAPPSPQAHPALLARPGLVVGRLRRQRLAVQPQHVRMVAAQPVRQRRYAGRLRVAAAHAPFCSTRGRSAQCAVHRTPLACPRCGCRRGRCPPCLPPPTCQDCSCLMRFCTSSTAWRWLQGSGHQHHSSTRAFSISSCSGGGGGGPPGGSPPLRKLCPSPGPACRHRPAPSLSRSACPYCPSCAALLVAGPPALSAPHLEPAVLEGQRVQLPCQLGHPVANGAEVARGLRGAARGRGRRG